jgi:hypothetical protein
MPCVNCQASTNVPPGGLSPNDICNGKYITSDCVIYSGVPLSTIDIENGDTFTTIINNVNNVVNNIVTGAFTANNGLTNDVPTNVQLGSTTNVGSPLLHDTFINLATFALKATATVNSIPSSEVIRILGADISIGDNSVSQNQNRLVINNTTNKTYLQGSTSGNNGLLLDYANFIYKFGETNGNASATYFLIDSQSGFFEFWGYNPFGTFVQRKAKLDGYSGQLTLDNYGIGTFVNTPTYGLGVDATGNVVETVGIVKFKTVLTSANIIAGGNFDITELPAPGVGYAWEIISCSQKLTGQTVGYDGSPTVNVIANGGIRQQYNDDGAILSAGADTWTFLERSFYSQNVYENTKMIVNITPLSTRGNGTLTIYGTARIITL